VESEMALELKQKRAKDKKSQEKLINQITIVPETEWPRQAAHLGNYFDCNIVPYFRQDLLESNQESFFGQNNGYIIDILSVRQT